MTISRNTCGNRTGIVSLGLTKKKQRELGLNQTS